MQTHINREVAPEQIVDTPIPARRRPERWIAFVPVCSAGALGALLTFAQVATATGTDALPPPRSVVGAVLDLQVVQVGQGPSEDGCENFKPSAEDVRAFLARAVLISGRQNHDYFSTGRCSASGRFESSFDVWEWTLLDRGTARLTATNGEVFLLGDPQQSIALEEDDCARVETACRDCGAEAP